MSNIEQQVKKIVAEQLGVNEAEVKNESSFQDDLGADSLDTVELVMAWKKLSAAKSPDEDAEKNHYRTIGYRLHQRPPRLIGRTKHPASAAPSQ